MGFSFIHTADWQIGKTFGRFERGHPEASQAMKELLKSTKAALRGRVELT